MDINKIYNENCLDTMARMPDGFIDLTVTSPPYDNLREYNGYTFDFETIAQELYRVTKQGGVVVWVVGDATVDGSETGTSFEQALYFKKYCGFNIHDTMIYHRNFKFPETTRYYPEFEYMFVFSKGTCKKSNLIKDIKTIHGGKKYTGSQRGGNGEKETPSSKKKGKVLNDYRVRGNVWHYNNGYQHSSKDDLAFTHPAIFPEKLARDHIYSWSNEGDLVYDPFMGSGTTAKMAHLQKRNWIGSEISKEYVELANKRLDPYLKQLTIF